MKHDKVREHLKSNRPAIWNEEGGAMRNSPGGVR